jgi:hypothetical protein
MAEWVMHHTSEWFCTIEADSEAEAWEKVQAFQCNDDWSDSSGAVEQWGDDSWEDMMTKEEYDARLASGAIR